METTQVEGTKRFSKVARRGFLGTLGAGGLTVATAVFGKSQAAYALCNYQCCHLAVCPNISYSSCYSGADYVWGCSVTGSLHCTCCEKYYSGASHSAASCKYN
jgi:hypothetical protein